MKKLITFLSLFVFWALITTSCDPKEPSVNKGDLVSATYDPLKKVFTLNYSEGVTERINAEIDNSTEPPMAIAKLQDGTLIVMNNAGNEGDAIIINKTASNNNKYINDWIYDEMSIYYLWNTKIPKSPNYSITPDKFFNSILYKYGTANPDGDRFSWIQDNFIELQQSLSGVSSDEIGFDYIFAWASSEKTNYYALVTYAKSGSDAEAKGVTRGKFITKINGQNITPTNYKNLFGGTGSKTLSMAEWQYNVTNQGYYLTQMPDVTISMHKKFAENPVFLDSVYTVGDKKIGYLVYNFFATDKGDKSYDYDKLLMNKLNEINTKGATEMILDLRYNSGGSVSTAIALASALLKNRSTNNILVTSQYNDIIHNALKSEYGADYNKEYFIDKITVGNTVIAEIPHMNFDKLYVLTGRYTASASEFVINGLKPYMDVILIGETTYGKNVGSITIYEENDAKNKWGMQPIIVRYANSLGNSDFTAGFKPNYEIDEFDDLLLFPFGDKKDPLLSKALSLITGGTASSRATTTSELRLLDQDVKHIFRSGKRFEFSDDIHGDKIKELMNK